jgi:hypothetical protein
MRGPTMEHPGRALSLIAVAAFLVPAPASAGASAVVYSGTTTGDQYPLVLTVSGSRIVGLSSMWRAACSSGKGYSYGKVVSLAKVPIAIRGGRFSGSVVVPEQLAGGPAGLVTVRLKGTIKGARITGTMTGAMAVGTGPSGPDDTCAVANLKFSLLHKPGTEYGGATSQGLPVVVELGSGGRMVRHLHVGWRETCTSGDAFEFADFLSGGALIAGRFGGTFSTNETRTEGGTAVSDYTISGKLSKTAGSGSLELKITLRDAAGATQNTCGASAVTFRVRA